MSKISSTSSLLEKFLISGIVLSIIGFILSAMISVYELGFIDGQGQTRLECIEKQHRKILVQ